MYDRERGPDCTKLHDPQTGLLIPFRSHSDALLAQLPLQHGMSKQHFNFILDILLDPSFSLDELNLRSATDVDVRISEYGRDLAEERSRTVSGTRTGDNLLKRSCPLDSTGLPSIVFDLVLEQMLSEMEHFSHQANATTGPNSSSLDEQLTSLTHSLQSTLRYMSLVHRSWTEPAQRALRRRIILTSRHGLCSFARSAACGSGVREFAYKIPKSEACTFFHEASVAREHWTTLASVVSRLSTLRYLCVSIESAHLADLSGLDLVLDVIEGLKSLEGLWLLSARDHCPYLPKLCLTISNLPNLRLLSIWNWTCPSRPGSTNTLEIGEGENILELSPPRSLRALEMRDDYLTTPPLYLAWLFQPRGSYSLDTLDLCTTFSRPLQLSPLDPTFPNAHMNYTNAHINSSHLLAALSPLLPALSTLAIKLFYLETSTASGAYLHGTDLQSLLSQCTSLRRIRLHRLRAGTHIDGIRISQGRPGDEVQMTMLANPLILPPTLEELHMHYTYSAINWRTQDSRLFGTLKASSLPCLKRVIVSNGETDLEGGKGKMVDPVVDLPKTNGLCRKLGVELLTLHCESGLGHDGLNQYVVDALA